MKLPKSALQELQEIYMSEFNVVLSDADAEDLGSSILSLANIINLTPRFYGKQKDDFKGRY